MVAFFSYGCCCCLLRVANATQAVGYNVMNSGHLLVFSFWVWIRNCSGHHLETEHPLCSPLPLWPWIYFFQQLGHQQLGFLNCLASCLWLTPPLQVTRNVVESCKIFASQFWTLHCGLLLLGWDFRVILINFQYQLHCEHDKTSVTI